MFILDFKDWLESAGEVSPAAKLTNASMESPEYGETPSGLEAGSGSKRKVKLYKNPFTTNNSRRKICQHKPELREQFSNPPQP